MHEQHCWQQARSAEEDGLHILAPRRPHLANTIGPFEYLRSDSFITCQPDGNPDRRSQLPNAAIVKGKCNRGLAAFTKSKNMQAVLVFIDLNDLVSENCDLIAMLYLLKSIRANNEPIAPPPMLIPRDRE
ncbi:MAG: hypothetical protein JOZ33_16110 [Acidobacteriaceae bacterium]|nr:hypothetical protein [Acidobacteriaceae bacterium]